MSCLSERRCYDITVLGHCLEIARCSIAMAKGVHPFAFAKLQSGSGEKDQAFEYGSLSASSTSGVPKRLPSFMGFPVKSSVKKVGAPMKLRLVVSTTSVEMETIAVPVCVANRMRVAPRQIRVGWKRSLRNQARRRH